MFGNPAETDEAYDPLRISAIDDIGDRPYRTTTEHIAIISRYCLLVTQDADGPPFTHVCGMPVAEIRRLIDYYASAKNMGIETLRRTYPWE